MRLLIRVAPVVVLALALGACGAPQGAEPDPDPPELPAERTFLSVAVSEAEQPKPLAQGTRIRLSFSDDEVQAHAGCNHIHGTARMEGDRLVVDGLGSTEMGCDQELMDQDRWLIDFLGSEPTLRLDDDMMRLTSGQTTIELLDRRSADPDRPLAGPRWEVDTIVDGETASSVPEGEPAYLVFDSDGTLSGHTGCNSLGARYSVSGSTIEISEIVTTKVACGGDRDQLERAVLSVLGSNPEFEIVAARLTLTSDDGDGVSLRTDDEG